MTTLPSDNLTIRAKRRCVVVVIGDGRGEPTVEQVNRVLAVLRNTLHDNPSHVVVTGGVAFYFSDDEEEQTALDTLAEQIRAALQSRPPTPFNGIEDIAA